MPLLLHNGGVLQYLDGTPVSLADLLSGEPTPAPMLGGHIDTIARFAPLLSSIPAL